MMLIILILESHIKTVQRGSLHGCFLSDFALRTIRRVLEGAANFTEMKGSEMAVAFVIPFWSASSTRARIKHDITQSHKRERKRDRTYIFNSANHARHIRTLYPLWKGA